MKQSKGKKIAAVIIAALLVICSIVVTILAVKLAVLPVKLIVGLLVVLWGIDILLLFLLLKKRKAFWPAAVVSVIMIVILGIGTYYLYHTEKMMSNITNTVVQTDSVSAYVLKDSPAEDIQDTEGFTFGILKEIDRENTDKAISDMESKVEFNLNCQEYEDMFSMVDELYENEIDAIIINDAFVSLIGEEEGYESFTEDIRALTTTIQEKEVEIKEPQTEDTEVNQGYFLAYISGIDTYGGVTNKSRSDVNILAAVNTETKQILLLSTPRDYYVELPISNGSKDKLTHAGIYGVEVSMGTLENLYDVDIDYFLRMNFSGFIDIVNALGGIDVYSEYAFTVEPVMSYQKGYNHVNGLQALAFARERHSFGTGDNQRGKNQMEVIKAVIRKCTSPSVLSNYAELMESMAGTFETDMDESKIAELVNAQLFSGGDWNVVSYSVTGSNSSAQTYSMPGRSVYVMEPDMDSVEKAQELLERVKNGEILSQEELQ